MEKFTQSSSTALHIGRSNPEGHAYVKDTQQCLFSFVNKKEIPKLTSLLL